VSGMIVARELYKNFGHQAAVDGLSFEVGAGEIYGLVGPDGAGKTTTMRLLCAALSLDRGQVTIGPYDMERQTELGRELIGYLPQRFSLYEELTVQENLRFFAEVRGVHSAEWQVRSREILEFVGLYDYLDRRAGRLSGGMKQKLGLAAALVHHPQVLLLDEPTTGVDPVTRQDFWQLIIRLAANEGTALLVSTPYMDEAARCSRLGFLLAGRMLLEGTPIELRSRLEGRILELQGFPLPRLRRAALDDPAVQGAQMFGDRLHVRVQPGSAAQVVERLHAAAAEQAFTISRLQVAPPQLEDVFMDLAEQNHA
jgi:ABC-2 type transport system ATP-binding protein